MSTKGRWLPAVAVIAGFVFAAAYYARQGGDTGQPGPSQEARREATPGTQLVDQPVTAAPSTDRNAEAAEEHLEAAAAEQSELDASDERIRSFTIPVERALAGMEEVRLRASFPPSPEFKETLRRFAAEGDDPDWSAATETRIFSEIAQATGLGAGNIEVDCRTTICRVLLTNPSTTPNPRYSGFNDLVDSFGLETLWILAVPDENGTPVNFAYVRRADP